MPAVAPTFAPGSRVVIRGEEWLVRRSDLGPAGDQVLTVSGLSPLVRNREAKFIDSIEALIDPITSVDPNDDPSDPPQAAKTERSPQALNPTSGADLDAGTGEHESVFQAKLSAAVRVILSAPI